MTRAPSGINAENNINYYYYNNNKIHRVGINLLF